MILPEEPHRMQSEASNPRRSSSVSSRENLIYLFCLVLLRDIQTKRLLKALANDDRLLRTRWLPTQMFPRLPAHATFVADTNFVSATNVCPFAQHGITTFILCPARLRAQKTS